LPATAREAPPIVEGLRALAGEFDVVLCDVWGVIHNGVQAYEEAWGALRQARRHGATVILVSNAPRPHEVVEKQLAGFGVPRDAWDEFVTSGDLSRELVAARPGVPLLHIGPPRDFRLFDGLEAPRVAAAQAQYVLCTGPDSDELEGVEAYGEVFGGLVRRGVELICANPDLVVQRGDKLYLCAGSLGAYYERLGGEVVYAGKPHRPIYDLALAKAARLRGRKIEPRRALAIGDAPHTDIAGANAVGAKALLVAHGIHAAELLRDGAIHPPALERLLVEMRVRCDAVVDRLRW
jgi:HAD superfamily hydrolase (TIGR01459 family)